MRRLKKHFYKLLYRLGVLKPYWEIDRYRYLRRVMRSRRLDWRYAQEADQQQFSSSEAVIRCKQFSPPVFFYCDSKSKVDLNNLSLCSRTMTGRKRRIVLSPLGVPRVRILGHRS